MSRPPLPAGWRLWWAGARVRTLPAAVVPVALGVGASVGEVDGGIIWWRAAAAGVVALALQVGVNFANDYSDGVRGTDADRTGPLRLVGSGAVEPRQVELAAFAAFGVAAIVGLLLAIAVAWWLVLVGVTAVAAAWGYTGGPRPYGYAGLGEVFVFVYFGLVATVGSAYVQTESLTALSAVLGAAAGLLATALLVVNNLRDIPGDTMAGKRTLAVRLGASRTRQLYVALIVGAFVLGAAAAPWRPWAVVSLVAGIAAVAPVRIVAGASTGRALIPALVGTGQLQLLWGASLTLGLALSG